MINSLNGIMKVFVSVGFAVAAVKGATRLATLCLYHFFVCSWNVSHLHPRGSVLGLLLSAHKSLDSSVYPSPGERSPSGRPGGRGLRPGAILRTAGCVAFTLSEFH